MALSLRSATPACAGASLNRAAQRARASGAFAGRSACVVPHSARALRRRAALPLLARASLEPVERNAPRAAKVRPACASEHRKARTPTLWLVAAHTFPRPPTAQSDAPPAADAAGPSGASPDALWSAPGALFLLAAAEAAAEGDDVGYSKSSYYATLFLFLISFPGLYSLVKRSAKSKARFTRTGAAPLC